MIKCIHKVFSVFLALLVLFSTVSFTVEKHFCGGELVDSAIFSKAEKCGSEAMEVNTSKKRSCCKDEIDIIIGQDELSLKSVIDLVLEHPILLTLFPDPHIDLFTGLAEQIIPYKDYNPPKIIRDIQLLTSRYLI